MYYPYSDSPELRRVAKAQKDLSDVSEIVTFQNSKPIIILFYFIFPVKKIKC